MMNDRNGKTSVSAVGGFIIIIVSCIGFLLSIYLKFSEGISGSSAFVLAGVALIPEKYFFQTVIFLCLADAGMGILKSIKLRRFSMLLLVVGLATKLGVSYVVVQIFQAFSSPQEFINSPDARNYFVLTWKLLVMFYPALSAFNNIFYVSNKKFPPLWWMMRMQNFNKDGDIEKLIGKQIPNEKE